MTAPPTPREQLFNAGWRFLPGDPAEAQTPGFSDDAWHAPYLPHNWSIEREFDPPGNVSGTGYLPGGIGWYRKRFTLPPETNGRRVFLRFEGIYRNSEVWINGAHLGGRTYGYIDFEHDLAPHLRAPGEENVLAVRVARENVADSRWYPGTGIYRNTWLTISDPIHVARHGVFITMPMVNDERAEVNSTCEMRNGSSADATVNVTATVPDADGQTVGRGESTHAVAAGQA